MTKENIPVITDREKLYDKCENMEQLFDKYYLPLLDKHYSKVYELQQENKQLKQVIDKVKELIKDNIIETTYEYIGSNRIKVLQKLIMDNNDVNELLDILKEVSE